MDNPLRDLYGQFLEQQDPFLNAIIHVFVIFITAAVVWWVFNLILKRAEKRYQEHAFFQKNSQLFFLLKKAGNYTILIMIGIGLINLIHMPIMEKIFYAFMIMLLASFTNGIFKNILPYIQQKLASRTETKIDDVIFDLMNRFASIILFVTAGILAMDVLGINIMPFIAGAGVAGIAIGFAAKDTLSNIIAGILLIIDRPFEVGDRIEVWSAPANSATWVMCLMWD